MYRCDYRRRLFESGLSMNIRTETEGAKRRITMKLIRNIVLLAVVTVAITGSATAQERGQYLPGFRGLNTAEQPGAGFTYANYFIWYPTSTFKDRNGKTAPVTFSMNLYADLNLLAFTPKKKILGATYSASVAIPIQNIPVSIPRVGVNLGGTGIGDIYVEPLSLGWALKKGKIRAAYGFMAPTGRYATGATNNTTTDYWGHQFTLGGTYNPGKTGLWQINASSVWEAHHKKRHEDVKVGNNVTFEYGVGKTFVKNKGAQLIQVGLVGYSEFQLTQDSGTAVTATNLGAKDSVHAIGPEFGVILPAKKFNFLVRVLPEYVARSRTRGTTVVFAIGKTF